MVISKELREDSASLGIFDKQIVRIAPHPFLPGLRGDHHRVSGPVEVFGHMLVPGIVTAQGNPAGLTGTQVDPCAARLDTFFANVFLCEFQLLDLFHV